MSKFKSKSAYYSVHALRDGTIWFAMQTRKPRKSGDSTPEIDEDGIHNWSLDEEDPARMTEVGRTVRLVTVAVCLNMKRIIRQQVEPKLDQVLERLDELEERIEQLVRDR